RDTVLACTQACAELSKLLGGEPGCVLVQATESHDVGRLRETLERLSPRAAVHGSTSCAGVMTQAGFHSNDGVALGLLGVRGGHGARGVETARLGRDPKQAGSQAVRDAIARAKRPGEMPAMIWLTSAPGHEEDVIAGIEAVLGHHVPIVGGSAADHAVAGQWQ